MKTSQRIIFLSILVLTSVMGLIASDIYLPAMPDIGNYLGTNDLEVKKTLSFFLLGLSFSQLIYGPITDKFGRKKVLIFGTLLYTLASVLCSTATNIQALILFRFLQAVGACSGMVIARAIVADLYSKEEGAKVFTTIFPIIGVSPAIAPVIGGLLTHYFSWRANFDFIALLGVVILCLTIFCLKESLPQEKRHNISLGTIARNYVSVLSNKLFLLYAILVCCAYGAYFAYLTNSSFLFSTFGYQAKNIGFFYITLSIGYISGNLLAKRIIKTISIDKALWVGGSIFLLGGLVMLGVTLLDIKSITLIILSMSILTVGNGFLLPLGIISAMSTSATKAGTASGTIGFLQLGSASVFSFLVGILSSNELHGIVSMILLANVTSIIALLTITAIQRKSLSLTKEPIPSPLLKNEFNEINKEICKIEG